MYYFAYGSNLSHTQMKKRCPSSAFIDRAVLKKYKRIFDGTSERWQSCTANLLKDSHSETIGAVYQINYVDFLKLDSLEEHEFYFPEEVTVELFSGDIVVACIFRSKIYDLGEPGPKYATVMLQGIDDCNLSEYKELILPNQV